MPGTLLRRPRAALVLVGIVIVIAIVASAATPNRLTVAGFTDPGSQSAHALVYMRRALGFDPEPGMVILARSRAGFRVPAGRAGIVALAATISRDPAVGRVETAFGTDRLPILLSGDSRETLLLVHFRSASPDVLAAPIDRLRGHLHASGMKLAFGGYTAGFLDVNRIARADLVRAELIAFPILALLLLLMFRGLIAAAVPLVIGGASVLGTVACLRLLSGVLGISVFSLNLAVLLGLGLAVDYGLLLVSRYREEAATLGSGPEAVRATLATAGRTVIFSSCAVAGACASLLLFPQEFIYSMGIAGVFVSLFSAAAALLITPSLLLIVGPRIGTRGPPSSNDAIGRGSWYRWASWVMRRHVDVALVSAALLVAAAAPALLLVPTFADHNAIPRGYQSRSVADTISRDFSPSLEYPVNVAIRIDQQKLAPEALVASIVGAPGVTGFRSFKSASSQAAVFQLLLGRFSLSDASQRVVKLVRSLPAPVLVGGRTAEFVDLKHSIVRRAPFALALAALATVIVVFLMTGSLVLAIKALLLNLLSISAVFGLLVLIFQKHVLGISGLLGYEGPAAIETTVSVVIVASTFGLATDYSILLLSRIGEEHEAGRMDEQAVARGMERSGPVITSAALLLAVALLALTSSRIFLVKELTVGLALGVVVDASLVRMLLVPAFMRILGRANWWAPGPLRRARTRIRGGTGLESHGAGAVDGPMHRKPD